MSKAPLTIRLTEPVVFLRVPAGQPDAPGTNSTMVRGLLTLHLRKASRIKNIQVMLQTRTSVIWPEGIGVRRLEIIEEHLIRSQVQTLFDAAAEHELTALPTRRAISVGPGLHLDDYHEHQHEHHHHHQQHHQQQQLVEEPGPSSAHSSIRAGVGWPGRGHTLNGTIEEEVPGSLFLSPQDSSDSGFASGSTFGFGSTAPLPPYTREPEPEPELDELPTRGRRISTIEDRVGRGEDSASPTPILRTWSAVSEEVASIRHREGRREGSVGGSPRGSSRERHGERYASPAQSTRFAPVLDSPSHSPRPVLSPSSSASSILTRGPVEEEPEPESEGEHEHEHEHEHETGTGTNTPRSSGLRRVTFARRPSVPMPSFGRSNSMALPSRPSSLFHSQAAPPQPPPISAPHIPNDLYAIGAASLGRTPSIDMEERSPSRDRDRSRVRGAIDGVRNMFRSSSRDIAERAVRGRPTDVVGGGGGVNGGGMGSRLERTDSSPLRGGRDRSPQVRGGRGAVGMNGNGNGEERRGRERERSGPEEGKGKDKDKDKDKDHHWKEFRKGTYTYPVVFSIPSNASTTVRTDFGSVKYVLVGIVHRSGPFATRLSAEKEVEIIESPVDDEPETVHIERQWEDSLRYLIGVDNKNNLVGGEVGIDLTLMPLGKVRIYRLGVSIEEKIEYFSRGTRITRGELPRRWELLSIKSSSKSVPLIPLPSFSQSSGPISQLMDLLPPDTDPSEYAASLLNLTGPWKFHEQLKIPMCRMGIHNTTKAVRGGGAVKISHMLKIVIRIERGEGDGTQKKWDIMVDTPLHLFDCRCTPEYTSLPLYGSFSLPSLPTSLSCACPRSRNPSQAQTPVGQILASLQSDGHSPSRGETLESLTDRNRMFERLVAGLEDVEGEAPPAYGEQLAAA